MGQQKLDMPGLLPTEPEAFEGLQGQGGPELQALKGVTIPVRLSGPFSAIGWKIDFQGMATELARQKLDERKDEVKAKVDKQLEKQKGKVQEQIQEQLKGLLGK